MFSKKYFVKTIQAIQDIQSFADDLSNTIGACDLKIDYYIENLTNALIEEVQNYIDEDVETHIDIGEIFSVYLYKGTSRNKDYLVKIDGEEFKPESPGELYNLITILKERFATAKIIDYATTM